MAQRDPIASIIFHIVTSPLFEQSLSVMTVATIKSPATIIISNDTSDFLL